MHGITAPRKYRYHNQMMTKAEATSVLLAHSRGVPVLAIELQEAIRVKSRKRDIKMRLPQLTPFYRMKVNATLLFNLGMAIGRLRRYEEL
jgi:hypothetical protein